jgi:hypothetical protein
MTTTNTATTNNKSVGSRYLANYLRSVKQANEPTAVQYEYRLSKFEKYVVTASEEEPQERHQQQNQELITLDHVINELKNKGDNNNNNNKIDPYDLLSGFVAYLEEEELELWGDVYDRNYAIQNVVFCPKCGRISHLGDWLG